MWQYDLVSLEAK